MHEIHVGSLLKIQMSCLHLSKLDIVRLAGAWVFAHLMRTKSDSDAGELLTTQMLIRDCFKGGEIGTIS